MGGAGIFPFPFSGAENARFSLDMVRLHRRNYFYLGGEKMKITASDRVVLCALFVRHEPQSVAALRALTGVVSASDALNYLASAGLVRRAGKAGRAVLWAITLEGVRAIQPKQEPR